MKVLYPFGFGFSGMWRFSMWGFRLITSLKPLTHISSKREVLIPSVFGCQTTIFKPHILKHHIPRPYALASSERSSSLAASTQHAAWLSRLTGRDYST